MIAYEPLGPFELYKRFKAGDDKAFKQLYDLFGPGLFNYIVRLVTDWHHAEDILVETFTKLAQSNLDDRGSLKAWLYRVATNQCYRWFRNNKEIQISEELLCQHMNEPMIDKTKEIKIQKFLNILPGHQKMVIILKFFDGMNYQEIADILCIPVGTVKSRIHEGLQKLREKVRRFYEM